MAHWGTAGSARRVFVTQKSVEKETRRKQQSKHQKEGGDEMMLSTQIKT